MGKSKALVIAIFSIILVAGCDGSKKTYNEAYDKAFIENWKASFIKSCINGSEDVHKSNFCNCIANKSLEKLTQEELKNTKLVKEKIVPMCEIVNQADSHKETNWVLLGVYEGSDSEAHTNVIFKVSVLYDQKIIKNGNITKANLKETIFNQTNKTDDGYITYEAEYDCNSMEQRKFNAVMHPSHNSVYVSKATPKDFEKTSTLRSQEGINALKLHFCN